MSSPIIAKNPNLDFIITGKGSHGANSLPMIIKKGGLFDWDANAYLTNYGGGSLVYNTVPHQSTVIKKSYSLNIFCNFLEDKKIDLIDINDSVIYDYVNFLKERDANDETILKNARTALDYIVFLDKRYPKLSISTNKTDTDKKFKVHYSIRKYSNGNIKKDYLHHDSFSGLIKINSESEYINDDELLMWFDAINCTTYHPNPDELTISRWECFTTILETTGSRISEVNLITRSMIKEAAKSLLTQNEEHTIKNIPINKGKYKGNKRIAKIKSEELQLILIYIKEIEEKFPNMNHDYLFVDLRNGSRLSSNYLKNYAKKVINRSTYKDKLKHLSNHSFRHRFITLNIARAIKTISKQGSFINILTVASNACRKITMHASNNSLSKYIHLASEINNNKKNEDYSFLSTQIKIRLNKMLSIVDSHEKEELNKEDTLNSLLDCLNTIRKYSLE